MIETLGLRVLVELIDAPGLCGRVQANFDLDALWRPGIVLVLRPLIYMTFQSAENVGWARLVVPTALMEKVIEFT